MTSPKMISLTSQKLWGTPDKQKEEDLAETKNANPIEIGQHMLFGKSAEKPHGIYYDRLNSMNSLSF